MPSRSEVIVRIICVAVLSVAASPIFAQGRVRVRTLAPGVLTPIPSEPKTEETFQGPIPLTQITGVDWQPHFESKTNTLKKIATQTILRRNIWNLDFSFKPLRMVNVDIPQPSGKMQRKLIWYMVYRVQNNGQHLTPVAVEDRFGHKTYDSQVANEVLNYGQTARDATLRFFPHFVLECHEFKKSYLDRVIPVAMPIIQQREMRGPAPRLYNSVEISQLKIPVSNDTAKFPVWGVVMWEDVEPKADYLSIYVQGLTNAFRLVKTDEGVGFASKTLMLNFWRPGDAVFEHEEEIRFGVPSVLDVDRQAAILQVYGLPERLDYLWRYQ